MSYFLIKFWVPEILDSNSYIRLVQASDFKKACKLITKKFEQAYDFENLTIFN